MRQYIRLPGKMSAAVPKQDLLGSESLKSSSSKLLARKVFRNEQNNGFRKQLFLDCSMSEKDRSTSLILYFALIVPICLLISAYQFIHRNDDDIELCMIKKLSDYQNYRKCKHTNSCEIYEYEKHLCKIEVEFENKLKNQ
jgi:hypothetical protein